jgi:hypothetical protein
MGWFSGIKSNFDWNQYPGSRIAKLPQRFQGLALVLRNLLNIPNGRRRNYGFHHLFDGIGTIHDMHFLDDEKFKRSQSRAIKASGNDYGIPLRLHQAIWCAELGYELGGDGIFVELGTGKGFVMSAVCDFLSKEFKGFESREVYLFDTFLPYFLDKDGFPDERLGTNPHYGETFEKVAENFSEWKNVSVVKGSLPATLEEISDKKISFLHIDLNSPRVEIECLRIVWNQVLPGAPILIDDYAYSGYSDTLAAFNNVAKSLNLKILTTASGQGLAFKLRAREL